MTRPDPDTLVYAGIGSRDTPAPVLNDMTTMSSWLARTGWHLTSGGAWGADTAFAAGAPPAQRTIYLPWESYNRLSGPDCVLPNPSEFDACIDLAAQLHPAWERCKPSVRRLHGRNAAILLGTSLDRPVNAVVAWTEGGALKGGTAMGLRIAAEYDIPVLNLGSISPRQTLEHLQAIRQNHEQTEIGQHINSASTTAPLADAEGQRIDFAHGDIFSQSAEAIVNPVNCVGVMGRGLALQFRERYPDAFEAYRAACEDQRLRPGRVFLYETGLQQPRWIVHFPTKRHWRDPSVMSDIEAGLRDLARTVDRHNIKSIAIPALGSGLGGLDWQTVRPLIAAQLASTSAGITVLEPRALSRSQNARETTAPTLRLPSRVNQKDNRKMADDRDTDREPPGADTATISQNLELYGRAPSRDEPDSRIVWDEEHSLAALGEAMRIIVQGITVEGTQMADEREPIMWGFANVLHSQVQRLDRAVDRIVPEIRELQTAQDGSEISAYELEQLTDRARNFGDRRDAFEKMRDMAAEAYRAETGEVWRPRHGSHISRTTADTQPRIDARDYRNATKQKQLHPHLYAGTVIALAGGKDAPNPAAVRNELDLQLSRHPDMVLAHGGAPGVEKIGAQWADAKGVKQIVCLPNWERHEKAAPFRRNEEIVKLQPKVLVAFPGTGITKNLVDKARQAGIPITTPTVAATRRRAQDPQPTIFNLNDHPDAVKNGAIPIGRETAWGNPFKVGEHGSREEVIARFTKDLWKRIRSGDMPLAHLAALNGRDLACGPDDCHGSVLASAASWAAGRLQEKASQEITAAPADRTQRASTQTVADAGDRSQKEPSAATPDASQMTSPSEAAYAKTRTEGTPDNAASESRTTGTDEPDSRIAWDPDDSLAALRQAIRVIAEDIAIEGTQMADEREPLMWGFVNMLHAQAQRIERTIKQDGNDLVSRHDAFQEMRDMAAEAYLTETGRPWQPRQPSHASPAATMTQAARDAQDYQDSLKKQKIDDHLPQGTIIALSGGKTVTNPDAVWNELDRALARKPDMILLHGNAPGVEKIGGRWAESKDITQIVCLPNWKLHEKAAPFRRNQEIINLRPKELIAFPGSGITDNLVDKATQAGIPVINASLSATISPDRSSQQSRPHHQPIILDLKQNLDAVKAGAIRIDRETRWANPFHIGQHGTREEVTSLYTKDLWRQIRSGDLPLPDLAALDGKTLACTADDCHGQVLASAATWAAGHLAKKATEHIPVTSSDPARQDPIIANSTAPDRNVAAPSTDTTEPSHAPTLASASQQSASQTQTQGPTQMHTSESFSASLQQFLEDYRARDREQSQTGIDRVLIPGLEQLSTAARTLADHPSAKELPTDERLALQITLGDQERYDHAVAATDDICKRLDQALGRFRHLEHLATIRAVDVSKIDSYDQWLAGAEKLSAEAQNMSQDHQVYDCGFTPAKWQEFTAKLLTLDTALGDQESLFLRDGPLYLEPLPHAVTTSEDTLKAHALYRHVREIWHEYIVTDGQYQPHPYEEVSPRIINTMRNLTDSTELPDTAKQAMSTIVADHKAYRDGYSDVETYLQDAQHSLETNRALANTIKTMDPQNLHAEDINGYSDWHRKASHLVKIGESGLSTDSTTFACYLRHNPDLTEQLKTAVTNLKNTLENPLPSKAQDILQHQQMDQHRAVSRGMRM